MKTSTNLFFPRFAFSRAGTDSPRMTTKRPISWALLPTSIGYTILATSRSKTRLTDPLYKLPRSRPFLVVFEHDPLIRHWTEISHASQISCSAFWLDSTKYFLPGFGAHTVERLLTRICSTAAKSVRCRVPFLARITTKSSTQE